MSAVDLVKKPARLVLESCPSWCVRDHAKDTPAPWPRNYHRSEFVRPASNWGVTVHVQWIEVDATAAPEMAKFDRSEVSVMSGRGLLSLPRREALEFALVMDSLGQGEVARLVREAAALIVGFGGAR